VLKTGSLAERYAVKMRVMVLVDLMAEDGKACGVLGIEGEDISELAAGEFSLHRSHLSTAVSNVMTHGGLAHTAEAIEQGAKRFNKMESQYTSATQARNSDRGRLSFPLEKIGSSLYFFSSFQSLPTPRAWLASHTDLGLTTHVSGALTRAFWWWWWSGEDDESFVSGESDEGVGREPSAIHHLGEEVSWSDTETTLQDESKFLVLRMATLVRGTL
jgi:hypothetical protein